jgi:hypothetical protein
VCLRCKVLVIRYLMTICFMVNVLIIRFFPNVLIIRVWFCNVRIIRFCHVLVLGMTNRIQLLCVRVVIGVVGLLACVSLSMLLSSVSLSCCLVCLSPASRCLSLLWRSLPWLYFLPPVPLRVFLFFLRHPFFLRPTSSAPSTCTHARAPRPCPVHGFEP